MICWIESVDPVADLCLPTNQIYSVLLKALPIPRDYRGQSFPQNIQESCFVTSSGPAWLNTVFMTTFQSTTSLRAMATKIFVLAN